MTPEELETQRKAQEELWQRNREMFAPFLHSAPAPAPEDLALKQRLMSAELAERQRRIEEDVQRDQKLREWGDEVGRQQRAARAHAKVLARKLGIPLAGEAPDGGGYHVDFRDGQLVAIESKNKYAARTIGTWKAKTNAPADYPLNANGQLVGLWELSTPGTNHAELNNGGLPRLIYLDSVVNNTNRAHATEMAGTIAAAGIVADAEGMASRTTILASNADNDVFEMGANALTYGLRLSNHSYGETLGWSANTWMYGGTNDFYDRRFGFYGYIAAQIDGLAYLHKGYLSVWAAGNDRDNNSYSGQGHFHFTGGTNLFDCPHAADQNWLGGYKTLTAESTAKNIITVGAIHDLTNGWESAAGVTMTTFSNFGPTIDGRTKPDVVANGQDVYSSSTAANGSDTYATAPGTSPAAASVTGSIALLRERFAQVNQPEPSAALVKALVLGTADEAGPTGPDYQFGFGVMNTDKAVKLILTNKYYFNPAGGLLKSHFIEGVLTNGTTWDITVNKNSGATLQAMLVWTDPAGHYSLNISNGVPLLSSTNLMLVNDLDVQIIHSGVTNESYALDPANPTQAATRTNNFRDNAELNVWHNDSNFAQFTIRVKHKNTLLSAGYQGVTTNQPFALMVTGHVIEVVPQIISLAQTSSNQVTLGWTGKLYSSYKVQHIDQVDALASAWSDSTGSILMTNNPAAVPLTMTNSAQRFYRVVRLP